ncbi:MAG: GGDEF domain-containing protein [Lachnospira sp.]|nr:GGDEF domain-containing protein [Lachnospira sp.]
MIITQYDVPESAGNANMALHKFSMDKDFVLRTGNNNFYRFIGDNACYPLTNMIHPMELKEFLEAVMMLDEAPQRVILRLKNAHDNYRTMMLHMSLSDRMMKGENVIDVEMCDIIRVTERLKLNLDINSKYRTFMTLADCYYFEYEKKTDVLKIYIYVNGKSIMIDSLPLDEWYENCIQRGYVDEKNKMHLGIFYENLKYGNGAFTIRMETKFLSKGERFDKIIINGEITVNSYDEMSVVGVMRQSKTLSHSTETDYYSEASRDGATGLLNKKAIIEYAMTKLHESTMKSMYMVVVDIDDFKQVNDTYGHLFGDEVISKVANIARNVVGTRGMVGRFGGDEFLMVLENLEDENDLRMILKSFSKQVAWLYTGTSKSLTVTLSMGISQFPDNATDYDMLFKIADRALYIAKQKGKNRYIIYREHMHGKVESDAVSENALGLRVVLDSTKLNAVISEIIIDLHKNKKEAITRVMTRTLEHFDIDGIAVYAGDKLERVYSVGKYINPIEKLEGILDEKFIEKLGEDNVIFENTTKSYDNYCKPFADLMKKQEVTAAIQCASREEDKITAMVSFDVFNRTRKWGGGDKDYLPLVAKLICQILTE